MDVVELEDAGEFLRRAERMLLADEARHNLILGVAGTLREHPRLYPEHRLWLVADDAEVVGAALRTPPYYLVLARCDRAASTALAAEVGEPLPGVVGAVPEVDEFAAAWAEARGMRPEIRVRQRIHALDEPEPPPRPASGEAREATAADRPLLLAWWRAFGAEALHEKPDEERIARSVDHKLAEPAGGIALWQDEGEPVSAAAYGSPTPNGIRIGPVYTPPELRGRGYASTLVAHVSAEQLARGHRFCFLYPDLANPTSNRIYADVGYRPVCDSLELAFVVP
jgi:GNAT superfamily N-acetyltransferase